MPQQDRGFDLAQGVLARLDQLADEAGGWRRLARHIASSKHPDNLSRRARTGKLTVIELFRCLDLLDQNPAAFFAGALPGGDYLERPGGVDLIELRQQIEALATQLRAAEGRSGGDRVRERVPSS